jgi:integrin-linked kinase-associated serine/threonine phosphatase 2C
MPKPIISKPQFHRDANIQEQHFGAFEILGRRSTQEDALVQQHFEAGELGDLTPEQIGQRLWTTYHELHAQLRVAHPDTNAGTTASTTIIHQDSLITATLADAVSFAVIYGQENAILAVKRLNTRTHNPTLSEELDRILQLEGYVFQGRVRGELAVSRAIGDFEYAPYLIADADINITSIGDIAEELSIIPSNITKVHVITTCDGYTEGVTNTQLAHENFLRQGLEQFEGVTELALAEHLTRQAFNNGSCDNISVAVQTLTSNYSGMLGVYDGHVGTDASHFVADNISKTLIAQCAMTEEAYAEQENSVQNNQEVYDRDNKKASPTSTATTRASSNPAPLEMSNGGANRRTSASLVGIHAAMQEKLLPLRKQYLRLEQRKQNRFETEQSKKEIRAASETLRILLTELSQSPTQKSLQSYLTYTQKIINEAKEETKNARGILSINRMLQNLSDWITSCFYPKPSNQDTTPNTQRFFKTTTEQTLDTLSNDLNHQMMSL